MSDPKMRVHAVYIYPIKGLRGCSPPSLKATALGFHYDRRFMLQQLSSGKHLSVSKFPEIALFISELAPAPSSSWTPTTIRVQYTKDHTFDRPDEKVEDEVLEVPIEPDWKGDGLEQIECNLHNSPTIGYEMPERYNEWFSKRLGYATRLVYIGENRRRVLGTVSPNVQTAWSIVDNDDPKSAPAQSTSNQGWLSYAASTVGNMVGLTDQQHQNQNQNQNSIREKGNDQGIGFADVAPFLVVSNKSYENAASRLPPSETLDITKFRPNIVIEGAEEAWEEDYWAGLSFGDDQNVQIAFTSNCARCASLNVDYATGKTGQGEAGKILKILSRDRRVDKGMKWSPIFGRYGFLVGGAGSEGTENGTEEEEVEIKVGDVVNVVERNSERTRFQWPGLSTDK